MTSKEALEDLRFNVSMSQDLNYKENNDLCDIIEKDLEDYELLKLKYEEALKAISTLKKGNGVKYDK